MLHGVLLQVDRGGVTGIFGRNGSGKTTIFEALAGQRGLDAGSIFVDGEPMEGWSRRRRFARIAYLPQRAWLPGELPLDFVARLFPRATEILHDEILRPLRRRRIGRLSGGERRYLGFSLVASLGRPYLILDEPLSGLEPRIIERVLARIQALADEGVGVLVSDQRVDDLAPIIGRCYVLAHGRCRESPASEIRAGMTIGEWE